MIIDSYKFASVSSYLLDAVPNALFAYDFRKLKSDYAGDCCNIVRNSDGAALDVPFDGDIVDEAAIVDHCGANTGYFSHFYDQSGNGNHSTTTIAGGSLNGSEPVLYESSAVVKVNTKPAVRMQGSDRSFIPLPTGLLNAATELTLIIVLKSPNPAGSNRGVFGPSSTNSVGLEILQVKVAGIDTFLRINNVVRTSGSNLLFGDDVQSLMELYGNASAVSAYYNNSAVTLSDNGPLPTLNFNGVYAIGRYSASQYMTGYIQSVIGFATDKSAQHGLIASNINSYYGMY